LFNLLYYGIDDDMSAWDDDMSAWTTDLALVGTGLTVPGVPGVVAIAAADGAVMGSCPLAARVEKDGDMPKES
jgi:hypothetical protein